MKTTILTITTLTALSVRLLAAGPGEGQITGGYDGKISKLEVKYNISQLMGEPTVYISYKWTGAGVKSLPPNTIVWLRVVQIGVRDTDNQVAYIRHDPGVPKQGEWAYDVAGSPSWDHVLFTTRFGTQCLPAKAAKAFWDTGFRVVDASLEYGN